MESWEREWRARPTRPIYRKNVKSEKFREQIALKIGGQESGIPHQTDEQLEHYALGHLPDSGVADVEEHLLLCGYCQERLDKLEPNARLIRAALTVAPALEERRPWFTGLWPRLLASAAGIAIAVAGAFLVLHPRSAVAPLASLQLTAVRGDVPAIAIASETDLTLTDAPPLNSLRVEVVDQSGSVVWKGSGEGGTVKVTKQLAPGTFFVRLYDSSGVLLHEYGFRIRD